MTNVAYCVFIGSVSIQFVKKKLSNSRNCNKNTYIDQIFMSSECTERIGDFSFEADRDAENSGFWMKKKSTKSLDFDFRYNHDDDDGDERKKNDLKKRRKNNKTIKQNMINSWTGPFSALFFLLIFPMLFFSFYSSLVCIDFSNDEIRTLVTSSLYCLTTSNRLFFPFKFMNE